MAAQGAARYTDRETTEMRRRHRDNRIEPPIQAELLLHELAFDGGCVSHFEGKTVFVDCGIPGERVIAELNRERAGVLFGRVVDVLEPSSERINPPCDYFGECGGCQLQHVAYQAQLDFKRGIVVQQLRRIGGFDNPPVSPTIGSENTFGYRNHIRFTAKPRGEVGFVRRGTHRFLRIDRCLIADPWVNDALPKVQERAGGLHQIAIRYGVKTGEVLVHPDLSSLGIDIESGQKHYHEEILGHRFRISGASFFQTNTPQAERLITLAGDRLDLRPDDTLCDAYAGVGTFAVVLADRVKKVVAIEESSAAVDDAMVNIAKSPNVQYYRGKVEQVLPELNEVMDALILDPPRAGIHPAAIDAVLRKAPARIAYVSCDPATLARDLKLLAAGPTGGSRYDLTDVTPVDMFPQTYHIECVASMRLA
ncbi:MAG TPA: class I SAM-dependent RNA methyltransferase [Dehalococcoidia bacterium]|nr:class I SAM-dependent RNA methyltransferase [Dehalococcoidia bacterium]